MKYIVIEKVSASVYNGWDEHGVREEFDKVVEFTARFAWLEHIKTLTLQNKDFRAGEFEEKKFDLNIQVVENA